MIKKYCDFAFKEVQSNIDTCMNNGDQIKANNVTV